jgi:hypothetical protein
MVDTDNTTNPPAIESSETSGFLAIIERAAMNPDIDVVKLERMMAMQERILAKNAEIAFNQAMARVSKKMPRIVKGGSVKYEDKNDKGSAKEAFKFARYEDIDEIVRPLLVEEGFSLSYTTEQREGGGCIMLGTLSHKDGHSRTASVPLALDTSGGKNNIQAMGSTTSYGRRYTMCMLLNIVTVGEDDDGKGIEFVSTEQAVEIDLLITKVGADKPKFLSVMGVDDVRHIRAREHKKAIDMLNRKAKKVAA